MDMANITFIYLFIYFLVFLSFFVIVAISWAASAAYGSSQATGGIGAIATGLHQSHSNAGSSHVCTLHHSSWHRQILNPLSKARDRTHVLMDTIRFVNHQAMMGTPRIAF